MVVLLHEGSLSNLVYIFMISFKVLTKLYSDFQNSLVIWTHWWGLWPSTAAWPTLFATFAKDCVGCASMPICCSRCSPISSIITLHSTSTRAKVTGGSPLIWESSPWLCFFLCFFWYLWKTKIIVSAHYNLRTVYVLSLTYFLVFYMHFLDPTILLCLMEWHSPYSVVSPHNPKQKMECIYDNNRFLRNETIYVNLDTKDLQRFKFSAVAIPWTVLLCPE